VKSKSYLIFSSVYKVYTLKNAGLFQPKFG